MKRIYSLLIIVLLLGNVTVKAQNDGISMTLLPHLAYNNFYNPGIPVEQDIVVGFGISNIGLGVYNSSIKYKNLYNFDNGLTTLDLNNLINSLDEHDNFINTNVSVDLLRGGARFGKFFVDVNWRLRLNAELHYSKDFLGFFINGNGHYLGPDNPADFSVGVDLNMFTEFAAGVQYEVNDKLTVGIRPKLLNGIANVSVNDDGTLIYTDPNTYEMTADANVNIRMSTSLDDDISKIGDFGNAIGNNVSGVFGLKDHFGLGVDFGASYIFNDRIGVALGVYDLGYIKWKDAKEKHNHKDGVVINDALVDDIDELLNMDIDLTDLYSGLVEDVWGNDSLYPGEDYKTALKTRIMLQGYYELNPMARFTAISQLYYVNKKLRPAITVAYSGSFYKYFNLTASYTLSKYAGNSIGAGVSFNLGPVNLYVVTDNVLVFTKLGSITKSLTSYRSANMRFGLVLTFGNNKK